MEEARLELLVAPAVGRNRLGMEAETPLTASWGGKCCCPTAGEFVGRSVREVYGTAGQAACCERSLSLRRIVNIDSNSEDETTHE